MVDGESIGKIFRVKAGKIIDERWHGELVKIQEVNFRFKPPLILCVNKDGIELGFYENELEEVGGENEIHSS